MTTLSGVTAALERCWTAIRTVHQDVRDAAMVVYLHERGDRRGHFWQDSWLTRENDKLDEVHISSHILNQGSESVFRTLLHEACHSVAAFRGIQETSRQGRYHNRRFADLATELGLVVGKSPSDGCVTLYLTDEARGQYINAMADLGIALSLWQSLGAHNGQGDAHGRHNTSVKLRCPQCRRIIRASRACVDVGPISCGVCLTWFVEVSNA